jgi:hypothetical protein
MKLKKYVERNKKIKKKNSNFFPILYVFIFLIQFAISFHIITMTDVVKRKYITHIS